jgi:DNA-binding beta-propeller fold protein YncE
MAMRTRTPLPFLVLLALLIPSAAEASRYLYVTGSTSGNIAGFEIGASGVLTPLPGAPSGAGPNASAIAITPDGQHLYVALPGADVVRHYRIGASGVLVPIGAVATGPGPMGLAVDPDGRRLFVGNGGSSVSVYEIAGSGALTPIVGSPFAVTGGAAGVAASPDGRHLFVANPGADTASIHEIAPSGALAPLGTVPAVFPSSIAVAPDASRLFVPQGSLTNSVLVYDVASSGAVTPVAGSPFPAGTNPAAVAPSPDGGRLYTVNPSSVNLSAYTVGGSGALTPVPGSPFGAGALGLTGAAAITPDSRRLYLPGFLPERVLGYDLGPSGTLTPIAGSPFASGVVTPGFQSLAIVPNQPPSATFTVQPGAAGSSTRLDAATTTDPDGAPARYDWDFGDGTTLPDGGPSPSHTYAAPGSYVASLTVTDDEGCSTRFVFTGQTASCNGGPSARAQRTITVAAAPGPPSADPDSPPTGPPTGPEPRDPLELALSGPKVQPLDRAVEIDAACSADCRVTAKGRVRSMGRGYDMRKRSASLDALDVATLEVKVPGRTRRAAERSGAAALANLKVIAWAADGAIAKKQREVKLKSGP